MANKLALQSTREQSVDELLACPSNSVLSGAWSSDANWTGMKNAELKRPGLSSRYYQYFSNCYQTVSGMYWWGVFNYWGAEEDLDGDGEVDENEDINGDGQLGEDWFYCGEKAGIDPETGEASKAVNFEIKFYTVGADGMPGDVVFEKQVSVMPRATGVVRQGSPEEYGQIYEFSTEFGETIRLESGFFSVSAVDESDAPTCWFSVISNDAVPGFGMTEANGEYWGEDMSMCYCLTGDGEYLAQKALKFNRLLAPVATATGKYEKVQVELMNVGEQDVTNATLELYEGDQLLAKETIGYTIEAFNTYKHTFAQRIDCSEAGTHTFTIKNVTEGDEHVSAAEYTFTVETAAAGGACTSTSSDCSMEYITSVKVGTIDNPSGATNYSDFTDKKAELVFGDTLELRVTAEGDVYVAAWVDWNGNGSFDDEGELLGYLERADSYIPVAIAEGTEVSEGEKRLRVMATYNEEAPCGEYYYGETEDYTLVVVRPDDSPALALNRSSIESERDQDAETIDLEVGNKAAGGENLAGTLTVQYALPLSPNTQPVTALSARTGKPAIALRQAGKHTRVAAPKADAPADAAYVLKYDKGHYDAIALSSGDYATYAQYYPGNMLSALAGMQLSSVDVYIHDAPDAAKIVIYGQNMQSMPGDLLAEKTFTPQGQAWNRVVLDQPLAIGNTDLWIGVYMSGFAANEYHIGIDEGPANSGFGDLVNVGGETWWSMAELGLDNNYCIRANVTGEPTPAISWLSMDKASFDVVAGAGETVAVTVNARGLEAALYEAVITINSNDIMMPVVKVPVYLQNNSAPSKVTMSAATGLSVYSDRNMLVVDSEAGLQSVALCSLNGMVVKAAPTTGHRAELGISDLPAGVYILSVQYADGIRENVKVPVVK